MDVPADYARLRQDLARAVARVCPAWIANQRDDIVQAAFMRVMQVVERRAKSAEGNQPLTTSYLYKTAYHAVVDEIRRVRRRREADLDDGADAPALVAPETPERLAASREIGEGIKDCLTRMQRDRRLAVTLHLQGHSVPEVSRILDWAVKRAENLVYRGLADLRACLVSKGMRP